MGESRERGDDLNNIFDDQLLICIECDISDPNEEREIFPAIFSGKEGWLGSCNPISQKNINKIIYWMPFQKHPREKNNF